MRVLYLVFQLFYLRHCLFVSMKNDVLDHFKVASKVFLKHGLLRVKLVLKLHDQLLSGVKLCFQSLGQFGTCLLKLEHLAQCILTLLGFPSGNLLR